MRLRILCLSLFLSASAAFAAAPVQRPAAGPKDSAVDQPGLITDQKSFSEIFETNIRASETQVADARIPLEVEFAYTAAKISRSNVANDYYTLNLEDQLASLSMFKIFAGYEVFNKANFFVTPGVSIGYAFREEILNASGKTGGTYRDVIRLKWAPIFGGVKAGYRIPGLNWAMVFARAGVRYEWLSVSGSLDGITQSYWNLGYTLSGGLNLFEGDPRSLSTWFGGVFFAAGVSRPFSSTSRGVHSTQYEFGVRFLL